MIAHHLCETNFKIVAFESVDQVRVHNKKKFSETLFEGLLFRVYLSGSECLGEFVCVIKCAIQFTHARSRASGVHVEDYRRSVFEYIYIHEISIETILHNLAAGSWHVHVRM